MEFNELLNMQGFAWHRSAVSAAELSGVKEALNATTSQIGGESTIASDNQIIGLRNLLDFWPACRDLADSLLRKVPGAPGDGDLKLVRVLYFDKPPGRSWSLPLHRDETVAVSTHPPREQIPDGFTRPTVKAGVCHLVAPMDVLNRMCTLRLHLDQMNDQNGPLYVVPGSHLDSPGEECSSYANMTDLERPIEVLQASPGDLLVMRPRLLHGSLESEADNSMNRRILHFEFAPQNALPSPLQWKWGTELAVDDSKATFAPPR